MEGHRPERQDSFTGVAHGTDVLLEPLRGGDCAELPGIRHDDWRSSAALRGHAIDVANPGGVAHIRTRDVVADTGNVVGRKDVVAGVGA